MRANKIGIFSNSNICFIAICMKINKGKIVFQFVKINRIRVKASEYRFIRDFEDFLVEM